MMKLKKGMLLIIVYLMITSTIVAVPAVGYADVELSPAATVAGEINNVEIISPENLNVSTGTPLIAFPSVVTDVYGSTLLSEKKPTYRSSSVGGSSESKHANDGYLNTFWMVRGQSDPYPQWWQVDLGQSYNLTRLETYWNKKNNSYKVEVSNEVDWFTDERGIQRIRLVDPVTVIDNTGIKVSGTTTDYFNTEARHVRITMTASADAWGAVNEFKVYGIDKIVSIDSVPDIKTVVGTSIQDIGLPAVVNARYSAGAVAQKSVTWDTANLDISDIGTEMEKIFVLEGNIDGADDFKAQVKVIVRHPPKVELVTVTGPGNVQVLPNVDMTYQYNATVKDQYGDEMSLAILDWSLEGAPAGVEINNSTGLLTLSSSAVLGSFKVKAVSQNDSSKYGEITVVMKTVTTYYVSTSGDDSNPGTISQPFRTIQKGADTALTGDTVYIRSGSYYEMVNITNHGIPGNLIVISGYPGETVIVDGQNTLPAGILEAPDYARYKQLVTVLGDYVQVRNLTVMNSRGRGVGTRGIGDERGDYALFSGLKVSYCYDAGIIAEQTKYTTVENCEVWECSRVNVNRNAAARPPAMCTAVSDHVIIKGNIVHNNYCEGIIDFKSDNSVVEDNIVYDNVQLGIYVDNSQYSTVRKNIVYWTDDKAWWRYTTHPGPGICISDETYTWAMNPTTAAKIYNNFVYNAGTSIALWKADPGFTFNDSIIAYNTFVNTRTGASGDASVGVQVNDNIPVTNSLFINNIVRQDSGRMTVGIVSAGFTFSNNLWTREPSIGFSNTNDIIGDPLLKLGTGTPDAEWLKLTGSSPVIDKAQVLEGILEDFFGKSRGASPDLGAHEFTASDMIMETINYINTSLDTSIGKEYVSKLNSVLDSIDKDNNSALNKLGAFNNHVEAQKGKELTDEQADYLIHSADTIVYFINN